MRIGACIDLAPRKLGSLEQWILLFAELGTGRGHSVHFFWREPVHPTVGARLDQLGVGWSRLDSLEGAPISWGRKLRRTFDLLYLNLVVPRSRTMLAPLLAWPRPIVYFDQISGPVAGSHRRSLVDRLLAPLSFRRVRALAGCSRYVTARDRERFRLAAHRYCTIHNGVDPEVFRPRPNPGTEPTTLMAAAYLIPEKGLHVLLGACAQIRDLPWRLVIVGDGPEAPQLRRLASDAGLADRVEFAGLQDDVAGFMRKAEVFIHPALWEEAFGLTVTEAMASGCATVASRVGGIPEIVEDGVSGNLVPPGDVEALAAALRLLLTDPASRSRLAAAGRERVLRHFTLRDSVVGQLDWIERWQRNHPD